MSAAVPRPRASPPDRLRVAMLQCEIPPVSAGGVGYQVHLLASTLSRRGHEMSVFTTHAPPRGTDYEVTAVRMPRQGRLYRQLGVALAYGALDLSRFDVVHAHGDDWLLRRLPRLRTFYGTSFLEARMATSLLRRGSQLCHYPFEWLSSIQAPGVTISRHTRRYLPLVRRCIPCAFDPEAFFPGGDRTQHPSVLFVAGTLSGRKRGGLLLHAFAEVRKRLPDAQLTIVSRDRVDHPGVTCRSGLSSSELGKLYRSHWLLCSTSSYEGFGVPYIEAMASGLPVVATHNPGARELLEEGKLAALCEPDELTVTIVDLLEDGQRRAELGRRGIHASRSYSIETVADQYEDFYREVIAEKERSRRARGRRSTGRRVPEG